MKTRTPQRHSIQVFAAGLLAVGLILGLTWALTRGAAAQEPALNEPAHEPFPPSEPLSTAASVEEILLGEPGLSFRYVQTFGETLVAYFADNSRLNRPFGVAVDSDDNVYIGEASGGRVMKYAPDGTFLQSIGTAGVWFQNETYVGAPITHLAVDSADNVWIAQRWGRVSEWNADGDYVGELDHDFEHAVGLDIDGADSIYVGDINTNQVDIFDSTGNLTATLGSGTCGPANDQFCSPHGIAVDSSGRIYVADTDNHRVQIFDNTHNHLTTLGTTDTCGLDANEFCSPHDVAIGPDGKVYVADTDNHRVRVFSPYPALSLVATLGDPAGASGTDNDHFTDPTSVAVDSTGRIYIADSWLDRVQQFNSSFEYVRTFGIADEPYVTDEYRYNGPAGVAADSSGNLLIVEDAGHRLIKVDASGTPIFTLGDPGNAGGDNAHLNNPNDVTLDAAGYIYVADTSNHRIQIYQSDGTYHATLGTGWGLGDDQFRGPFGVAVDGNGSIYVADGWNHRVQIYDSNHVHMATLGSTGNPGTGDYQFDMPVGVTVDQTGYIYLADEGNHRVQVYDASRTHVRTLGVTGECGDDFAHFCRPNDVAVDKDGRLYVADQDNRRIQVFDQDGAYFTSIGGWWGTRNGENANPWGVEVDAAGNVYIADGGNHRIQKFAPGVPGWTQVNINGFGYWENNIVMSLTPIDGKLYAGVNNWSGSGAQLWRLDDVGWTSIITDGFGNTTNSGIVHLVEFQDQIYAGTVANDVNGGEIWRSDTGNTWGQVVSAGFGDPTNLEVPRFTVFDGQLYAATRNDDNGAEIWRSSSGDSNDWEQVVSNGFDGDVSNAKINSLQVYSNTLYAGTSNFDTGGELWRSSNGTDWTQVNDDGFGDADNLEVFGLATFNNHLYVSTRRRFGSGGIQIWRCYVCGGSDWEEVVDNGFGNSDTTHRPALEVFDDRLYAAAGNLVTGMEVWHTEDGTNWRQVSFAGFGDSNNYLTVEAHSMAVHDNQLYIGTYNLANGGEVWRKNIAGDLNGDDALTVQDLSWMAGWWRQAGDYYFDLDGDGRLTVADLMQVVTLWENE